MKAALFVVLLALGSLAAGGLVGIWYTDTKHAEIFTAQTGLTVKEFNEAYAQCVIQSGELCNLYGGFAPLSKFSDGRDGQPPKDML